MMQNCERPMHEIPVLSEILKTNQNLFLMLQIAENPITVNLLKDIPTKKPNFSVKKR